MEIITSDQLHLKTKFEKAHYSALRTSLTDSPKQKTKTLYEEFKVFVKDNGYQP